MQSSVHFFSKGMKNVVRPALVAALLLGAVGAQAQISFGPKVGVGLASRFYKYDGNNRIAQLTASQSTQKMIVTPSFGLMLNARFGNLAIQPALMYAQKGYQTEQKGLGFRATYTARLSYVDIPVNFVYTISGNDGFQVFVGPYISIGISGKVKSEGTCVSCGTLESDVEFATKQGADATKVYMRNPDFGFNAGIGYVIKKFQIQAGYGLGLSNLAPNDINDRASDYKFKSRMIHFTTGYLFGGE